MEQLIEDLCRLSSAARMPTEADTEAHKCNRVGKGSAVFCHHAKCFAMVPKALGTSVESHWLPTEPTEVDVKSSAAISIKLARDSPLPNTPTFMNHPRGTIV